MNLPELRTVDDVKAWVADVTRRRGYYESEEWPSGQTARRERDAAYTAGAARIAYCVRVTEALEAHAKNSPEGTFVPRLLAEAK